MSSDLAGSRAFASTPFFIMGCPRSGTTMLRDILRLHPNLAAPEETHFFRWPEPFGSTGFADYLQSSPVFRRHRSLDGISEPEFVELLRRSVSRMDLCRNYMQLYIERNKPSATRWFDKTPQHVYGALLIGAQSNARMISIVRDPVQVVSSLFVGKVVKMRSLVGACNYWNEASDAMHGLRRAYPNRVYELRYEDFTAAPLPELQRVLDFVGESFEAPVFAAVSTRTVTHDDEQVLTPAQRSRIEGLCRRWRRHYGYEIEAARPGNDKEQRVVDSP